MKKSFFFCSIIIFATSCKMLSGSDSHYSDFNENKIYRLQLKPIIGSRYYYDIINETEVKLEVNDKKVDNINKSTVGVYYTISKDTAGNFLFRTQYDTIHLYSKSGDTETDMDAANAAVAINPVEKMLSILKEANIVATVSPAGEVKEMSGYKEMSEKIMASFDPNDVQSRTMAQSQWERFIGDGLIKKNMDQLFKIFPDSAVRIGDKWKLDSKQSGELNLNVKAFYKLNDINDGIALIESEGKMASDATPTNLMGQSVVGELKGQQQGEYEVETKTGMLLNSKITYKIEGTIEVMGKEIPITIESTVKMNSRKLK